jgi:hypothetical protein
MHKHDARCTIRKNKIGRLSLSSTRHLPRGWIGGCGFIQPRHQAAEDFRIFD